MLAIASAALIYKIPVAHLHGGEVTEGAYDDSIRHAITKMSHLHFTSTQEYRNRVIQLGESPERVFNVGALGVENIFHTNVLSKEELEKELGFLIGEKSFVVTFHPTTLSAGSSVDEMQALLDVLSEYYSDYKILFTLPNSDTDNQVIKHRISAYAEQNRNVITIKSLGRLKYFSVLNYVSAVVGNSSSGIIEAPSFGIPTLNIGDRQKGRIMPPSVVNCAGTYPDIQWGMEHVLSAEMKQIAQKKENPYMKQHSAMRILDIIKNTPLEGLTNKKFHDL